MLNNILIEKNTPKLENTKNFTFCEREE